VGGREDSVQGVGADVTRVEEALDIAKAIYLKFFVDINVFG
jgi:hypothetical protein